MIPKSYLPLREAVIRLAERRAPEAGARRYLEYLGTNHEVVWQEIMATWPADVPFGGRTVTAPPSPAWGALEAARDELRQALGDADLVGMLLSLSNGGLSPSKPERWRVHEGFAAFQSGRLDGGDVLLCEASFARWLSAATPTVATIGNATTPAPAAEPQYPAIGDVPEHRLLTACEVLTWIGYGRAISKDVYFAPFANAPPSAPEGRVSLLHQSVPDPKPAEDPMSDAERKLMEALRTRHVHILFERNGAIEEELLVDTIYEHAVSVNARGSLEADAKATERDQMLARSFLSRLSRMGDAWFRKSEVLAAWPAPSLTVADAKQPRPRPVEAFKATAAPLNNTPEVKLASTAPVGGQTEAQAQRLRWYTLVKSQRGKEKEARTLKAWAARYGDNLPARDVLLTDFRLEFGRIPGISQRKMRQLRAACASDRAKRGGAPTHKRN
jgi:hypothetical protein